MYCIRIFSSSFFSVNLNPRRLPAIFFEPEKKTNFLWSEHTGWGQTTKGKKSFFRCCCCCSCLAINSCCQRSEGVNEPLKKKTIPRKGLSSRQSLLSLYLQYTSRDSPTVQAHRTPRHAAHKQIFYRELSILAP